MSEKTRQAWQTPISTRWAREMQTYSAGELQELLGIRGDEALAGAVERLRAAAVLKTLPANTPAVEAEDADPPFYRTALRSYDYKFSYVGLLQFPQRKRLVFILPKYCAKPDSMPEEERRGRFAEVLQVIHRYGRNCRARGREEDSAPAPDFLQVMLELVTDFAHNGPYRDDEQVDEMNGNGRILWERTINRELPILHHNRPLYMELHTRRRQQDELNFFTRLHRHLAHRAWQMLEAADLPALLRLPDVPEPEDAVDDLLERDYVASCIRRELARQFDSRRRYLLRLMLRVLHMESEETDADIHLFGKSGFHVVWEEACRAAYGMRKSDDAREMAPQSAPVWQLEGWDDYPGAPLQADLVDINEMERTLSIIDAKYYIPRTGDSPEKLVAAMPGLQDIIKQQLYERALRRAYAHIEFREIRNTFILPLRDDDSPAAAAMGRVDIPMLTALGLAPVQIRKVPPHEIWLAYLAGKAIRPPA